MGFKSNPYIICEIGSNWLTLEDCLYSIIQAKIAGADAVKFQLFTHESLYGFKDKTSSDDNPTSTDCPVGVPIHKIGVLPPDWLPKLAEQCERVGIDFMCSAFSPELIDVVDPYVKTHKLASSEMCHVRMLEAYRRIGKPLIMSTGAQTTQDIISALYVVHSASQGEKKGCGVTLMYCVSAYPAHETDLDIIAKLGEQFNLPVGFSDHSLDYLNLPFFAWRTYGATVIEKHFTAIDAQTPDSGHSLNPDQFKKMVDKIRGNYKSVIGPTPSEKDMVLRHKRRIIATRDIKAGQIFQEGYNFGIFRSLKDDTKALIPFAINHVNDKSAKRDIKCGDGICPGDI